MPSSWFGSGKWFRIRLHNIKHWFYERKAKKEGETATDKAARVTALATGWMAVFNLILMLVGIGTYLILKNQLREMHEGGIDTHELASQARNQADNMKDLSERMKEQADQTKLLANAAKVSADASKIQATAALRQVDKLDAGVKETHALAQAAASQAVAAVKALTVSQRPQIYFDLMSTSGLTFDKEGAHMTLAVTFRNTGGSAAPLAGFFIELFRPAADRSVLAERQRVCDIARRDALASKAILAGQTRTDTWNISQPPDDIDRSKASYGGMYVADLIACVSYRSPVDETLYFSTARIASIARAEYIDKYGGRSFAIMPPEPVELQNLILTEDPISGLYAN